MPRTVPVQRRTALTRTTCRKDPCGPITIFQQCRAAGRDLLPPRLRSYATNTCRRKRSEAGLAGLPLSWR